MAVQQESVSITDAAAPGRFVIVCEHASNHFPERFGSLGLTQAQKNAHISWDPGALGLARGLAARLDAPLVAATVSRLIFDCNRPPNGAGAMASKSEMHDIPGNCNLTAGQILDRTEAVYLPFHAGLHGLIARRLSQGIQPVIVTVHSFTPTWFGTPREVEFGVIHDADPALALAVVAAASRQTGLRTALNAPYSAEDGVTHMLRLHATPYGLRNVMLEVRNDLIATPKAEDAMAETLAPLLADALAEVSQ